MGRTYEENLEYVASVRNINEKYIFEMRTLFDEILKNKNYDKCDFTYEYAKKDSFIMTGTAYKIQTACLICLNEIKIKGNVSFFDDIKDCSEAIAKMDYITFLLRRVELFPDDEFSKETYQYITNNNISIVSIITIVSRGAFEWCSKLTKSLFLNCSYNLDNKTKYEWLFWLSETYKDDEMFIYLANHQIECGLYKEALESLTKVANKTESIKSLIDELGGIINE